jgi:hypothetical protein
MAGSLYPPPRPLAVGETLDLGFRIFRATLLTSLMYSGLAVIAGELPSIYNVAMSHPLSSLTAERSATSWVLSFVGVTIWALMCCAILLRQHAVVTGGRPQTAAELAALMPRLPGLLLLFVLVSVATSVWFLPLLALRSSDILTQGSIAALLAIPATYVGVPLVAATPVFLLTGAGATASLARSWRLSRGSWWRLAAVYTVGFLLLIVMLTIAGSLAMMLAMPITGGDLAQLSAVNEVVVVMLSALGWPFILALVLAAYGDLTVRREGTDLAQKIAAVG